MGLSTFIEGIAGFLRWWRSELAALTPASLKRMQRRRTLIVTPIDASAYAISKGVDGTVVGEGPPDALVDLIRRAPATWRLILRLPQRLVFTRTKSIPNSALGRLRSILEIDLAAHTPFKPTEVSFAFVAEPDSRDGAASVRQVIVKNDILNMYLDVWAVHGVKFDAADAEGFNGLNLLFGARARSPMKRIDRGLVALAASVFALVAAIQFHQAREIAVLTQQRARLDEETAQVRAAASQAVAAASVTKKLTEFTAANPPAIAVLAELTALLPDDVYLRQFKLDGETMAIDGSASSASSVISLIENSPHASDVAIEAPITPDATGNRENFRLSFRVTSAKPETEAPTTFEVGE